MSSSQNKHKFYETAGERQGQKQVESTRSLFRPLGFDHCALSLQPFRDPVMSKVSHAVFDITNLVPFVQKHGLDPITGEKMTLKDILKLHFHKLESGKYGCPATFKEFTDHSHIVAIGTSGYVYSHVAVQELNVAANNWTCLESSKPFKKSDIITIQDPTDPARRNVSSFHHVRFGTTGDQREANSIRTDPSMRRVLDKMADERSRKDADELATKKRERERLEAAGVVIVDEAEHNGNTPMVSADFTSMGFVPKQEKLILIPGKKTSRKGTVRLYTTHGQMDVTLHADLVPVASENFLRLVQSNYFDGIKFHRLIKGFMVQGGDPSGSGRGGESTWGTVFQDEFVDSLKHSKRGVLSMANSGPNTNRSQFFIIFGPRAHLDKRHTVFGEVSGGLETLDSIEQVPTGPGDSPLIDVVLTSAAVLFNPFEHLDEEQEEEKAVAVQQVDDSRRGEWFSNISKSYPKPELVKAEGSVGKYLASSANEKGKGVIDFGSAVVNQQGKKRAKKGADFGANF